MNTISPIRPYVSLKNEPTQSQTVPTEQTPVAFKGALGDSLLREVAVNKSIPTVDTIISKIKSTFGISTDKTKDVLESLLGKIKSMTTENTELKEKLLATTNTMKAKEEQARAEFAEHERNLRSSFAKSFEEKNAELAQKDAKIAELQKYEGMAKVKSVDELDEISPEQFLEILKEAKESAKKAQASLLNYLFKGNGQEEFLAQIERNNQILKARESGIESIPEIAEAYKKAGTSIIGWDPVWTAQKMVKDTLINSEEGSKICYPPIKKVVAENMDALLTPMQDTKSLKHYDSSEKVLTEVTDFFTNLNKNKNKLEKEDGYIFDGKAEFNEKPYYSFHKNDGEKYDIFLDDLAYGWFVCARVTKADGSGYCMNNKWNKQ